MLACLVAWQSQPRNKKCPLLGEGTWWRKAGRTTLIPEKRGTQRVLLVNTKFDVELGEPY